MTELPQILPGHAPLDVCHRNHTGVAHHVMPGCECAGPKITDETGQVIARGLDRVDVWENGKRRSLTIAEAKAAGMVY
jgi:hypothetical protein